MSSYFCIFMLSVLHYCYQHTPTVRLKDSHCDVFTYVTTLLKTCSQRHIYLPFFIWFLSVWLLPYYDVSKFYLWLCVMYNLIFHNFVVQYFSHVSYFFTLSSLHRYLHWFTSWKVNRASVNRVVRGFHCFALYGMYADFRFLFFYFVPMETLFLVVEEISSLFLTMTVKIYISIYEH